MRHIRFFLKGQNFCFIIVSMCVAWTGHSQNGLDFVRWAIKPYSLTHSLMIIHFTAEEALRYWCQGVHVKGVTFVHMGVGCQ